MIHSVHALVRLCMVAANREQSSYIIMTNNEHAQSRARSCDSHMNSDDVNLNLQVELSFLEAVSKIQITNRTKM